MVGRLENKDINNMQEGYTNVASVERNACKSGCEKPHLVACVSKTSQKVLVICFHPEKKKNTVVIGLLSNSSPI